MSNKPSKVKKIKSWQIGNFIVSIQGKTLQTIQVKATAGHWSETFRSDTDFYQLVKQLLDNLDDDAKQYLHNLFSIHYLVSFGMKDNKFMGDVIVAHSEMAKRLNEIREVSEEENKEILNKEKEKYENGEN